MLLYRGTSICISSPRQFLLMIFDLVALGVGIVGLLLSAITNLGNLATLRENWGKIDWNIFIRGTVSRCLFWKAGWQQYCQYECLGSLNHFVLARKWPWMWKKLDLILFIEDNEVKLNYTFYGMLTVTEENNSSKK